jgi:DNA repair protein RecO (recombination protein O)
MPTFQDRGVTLRRLDYSETSQILVVFTQRYGKVRMIAKGIRRSTRKRFATGIDLLEEGDVAFSVRTPGQEALAILTAWRQRSAFSGIRGALPRIHAAEYAAEVVAALTEDWDPHPQLFDTLVRFLEYLAGADEVMAPVVRFQRRLLEAIGSIPRFDVCAACGRPLEPHGPPYFSSREGGLLCPSCEASRAEKRQVRPDSLDILRSKETGTRNHPSEVSGGVQPRRPSRAPDARLNAMLGAFDIFNYHISHLMGRAPLLAACLVDPRRARTIVPPQ